MRIRNTVVVDFRSICRQGIHVGGIKPKLPSLWNCGHCGTLIWCEDTAGSGRLLRLRECLFPAAVVCPSMTPYARLWGVWCIAGVDWFGVPDTGVECLRWWLRLVCATAQSGFGGATEGLFGSDATVVFEALESQSVLILWFIGAVVTRDRGVCCGARAACVGAEALIRDWAGVRSFQRSTVCDALS
ncbi:hypothetical protein FGB62_74g05 [Gracilaria domingensis]|nr:hypothetical protein FGB62_74g05 [Gracilaria domingensis]